MRIFDIINRFWFILRILSAATTHSLINKIRLLNIKKSIKISNYLLNTHKSCIIKLTCLYIHEIVFK